MSTLSVRLPESLHQQIRELAKSDNISINQFIASAAAEKTAAFLTQAYLEKRAKQASREKFLNALAKVADVEPDERDRL
jgi:uncharacterized protein (DUF1778 family)